MLKRVTLLIIIILSSAALAQREPVLITFQSDPTGAALSINGEDQGVTPITVELEDGRNYSYRLEIPEPYTNYRLYKPYEGTFSTWGEQTIVVWIDRTSAEEQEAARAAYERQRRDSLEGIVRNSPWEVIESSDPITDANTTVVASPAVTYPSVLERNAFLGIRCATATRHGVEVIFSADTYLGRGPTVDYRVDSQPAVTGNNWSGSTTGTAVFVPSSAIPTVIDALRTGSQLTARIYDFSDRAYTYTFSIDRLEEALLLQGCYTGLN